MAFPPLGHSKLDVSGPSMLASPEHLPICAGTTPLRKSYSPILTILIAQPPLQAMSSHH